jgi:CRISPR-associated protein Cmr6
MEPNIGWMFYREIFNNYLGDSATFNVRENGQLVSRIVNQYNWNDVSPQASDNTALMIKKSEPVLKYKFNINPILKLEAQKVVTNEQCFYLKTIYPGLLIGSGYTHETGITEELKLGFFFDYTTGQPIIPGSSIKGLLRSAFEKFGTELIDLLLVLKDEKGNPVFEKDEIDTLEQNLKTYTGIKRFVNEVFEGKDENDKAIPIYKRDIFHDAIITVSKFTGKGNTDKGRILGNDYITPHKHRSRPELDPFTEPTPLQFLKVLPNTVFNFQFNLKQGIISSTLKRKLFKSILLTLGIGAKTNVGYGQFREANPTENATGQERETDKPLQAIPSEVYPQLKKGAEFSGMISDVVKKYYLISLTIGGKDVLLVKSIDSSKMPGLKKDDKVKVKLNAAFDIVTKNLNFKLSQ